MLCKRAAKLGIDIAVSKKKGRIDVVLDSTGLKVHGEGEWRSLRNAKSGRCVTFRTPGKSKRRTWRKLHLMIDPETQEIIADELTTNGAHDTKPVPKMLDKVNSPVKSFTATAFSTQGTRMTNCQNGISNRSSRRRKTRY